MRQRACVCKWMRKQKCCRKLVCVPLLGSMRKGVCLCVCAYNIFVHTATLSLYGRQLCQLFRSKFCGKPKGKQFSQAIHKYIHTLLYTSIIDNCCIKVKLSVKVFSCCTSICVFMCAFGTCITGKCVCGITGYLLTLFLHLIIILMPDI